MRYSVRCGYPCQNSPVADEYRFDLAVELFQDEGPVPIMRFLRSPSSSSTSRGEDDRHRFRHILREHGVGRLQVDADGVLVRRFQPLDFLEA
jgi:hypothetical protein